jgi:Na+:H+ antiporter, NhaA family
MYNDNPKSIGFNIRKFIQQESFGGFLLIGVTIIAVIWANSDYYDVYDHIWHNVKMGISFGDFELKANLHHWVNDGLMAIFFFVIGLEIKREVAGGELSSFKRAILPLGAAVGGMFVPALIYVAFNYDNPQNIEGWGIPMATDIAFALGLLSLLGNRVSPNLKIFLTALAIADDLGAILVIAFFYTESIDMTEIINAVIFLGVLVAANKLGVRNLAFYAVVGIAGIWLSFVYSGVHATIAGVLIALTIPGKSKISGRQYIDKLKNLLQGSKIAETENVGMLTNEEVHSLDEVTKITRDAESPAQKLEHLLHPVSAFIILPLFALANAGVRIEGSLLEMLFHPISLGIIAGLVLGKLLGISLFTHLIVKMKISSLPKGVDFKQIYGAALLAGIGFTMSIFISDLAFSDAKTIQIAKVGVFAASLLAALLGMLLLSYSSKQKE